MILKWSRVSRRSGFYLNNLANGVLTAGMRFNRPKRVTLRLKQMGFFLARLLILAMALLAAALLGRLAGALFFRGFLANLLKSPNLSRTNASFSFFFSYLPSRKASAWQGRLSCVSCAWSQSLVIHRCQGQLAVEKTLVFWPVEVF